MPYIFPLARFETNETLNTVPLKQTPLQTNVVCPQFPHYKEGITVLTSWTGYSIKCNDAHECVWHSAWHTATRTTQVLGLIHCSIINVHLLWAELCTPPTPPQNSYVEVLTSTTSEYDHILSLPK